MGKYDDEFPDDDLDDVSVTSSHSSHGDKVWEYECILAERTQRVEVEDEQRRPRKVQKKFYLVQWVGWHILESTWTEEDKLLEGAEQAKFDWEHHCMKQLRGREAPFDIAKFEVDQKRYMEDKALRHERKRAKRIRLGLSVKPLLESDDEDDDDFECNDESEDDVEELRTRPPSRRAPLDESSDDDEPLANRITKLRCTSASNQASLNDDDEQPLIRRRKRPMIQVPSEPHLREDDTPLMQRVKPNSAGILAISEIDDDSPISPAKRRKLSGNVSTGQQDSRGSRPGTSLRRTQTEPDSETRKWSQIVKEGNETGSAMDSRNGDSQCSIEAYTMPRYTHFFFFPL